MISFLLFFFFFITQSLVHLHHPVHVCIIYLDSALSSLCLFLSSPRVNVKNLVMIGG
jgi:hypothetical protein